MDRLERKTNIFYLEYLPEIKEILPVLKSKGVDVSEIERLIQSLESAIKNKDYLTADQLIVMLQDEVEKAKIDAGIFDNTGLFF